MGTQRMTNRWYFPPDMGGEENGLNDAGIEFFKSTGSLARETVQNSGDAHDGGSNPVRVRFALRRVPRAEFPGVDELSGIIESARHFVFSTCAPEQRAANGEAFFKNALEILNGDEIPMLQISDFNTTGLEGGETEQMKGWYRLVRKQGTTSMHGAGGGTFGIGQRAPFAYSDLRTVFYGTRTKEGTSQFIGKSILCSFRGEDGQLRRQVGFWGQEKLQGHGVNPLSTLQQLPEFFSRNEVGTDLYVAGFMRKDWISEVAISLIRNFFAALIHRKLVIDLEDEFTSAKLRLDHETLHDAISKQVAHVAASDRTASEKRELQSELASTRYYLDALSKPHGGAPNVEVVDKLGEVRLYLCVEKDAPSRIAFMRRPRILVYDRSQKSALRGYAGVVICENDEGNAALARLEDPAHQKWDRNRDPGGGALLQKLYEFVRNAIKGVAGMQENEVQDLPELGKYLPDQDDEGTQAVAGGVKVTAKTTKKETGKLKGEAATKPHVTMLKRKPADVVEEAESAEGSAGNEDGASGGGTEEGDKTGAGPGGGSGTGVGGGRAGGRKPGPRQLAASDIDYRAFEDAALPGCVTLVVWSPKDGVADLTIGGAGITTSVPLRVLSAENESGLALPVEDCVLPGIAIKANVKRRLVLKLEHSGRVAVTLGVRGDG